MTGLPVHLCQAILRMVLLAQGRSCYTCLGSATLILAGAGGLTHPRGLRPSWAASGSRL